MIQVELVNLFEGVTEVKVLPEDLHAAEGKYRSDYRFDVMRWDGYVEVKTELGWARMSIGSWDTMTDCVKRGIELSCEGIMDINVGVAT